MSSSSDNSDSDSSMNSSDNDSSAHSDSTAESDYEIANSTQNENPAKRSKVENSNAAISAKSWNTKNLKNEPLSAELQQTKSKLNPVQSMNGGDNKKFDNPTSFGSWLFSGLGSTADDAVPR